jgi:hypothetical protein
MKDLIAGVKKFSVPMFIIFVFSKLLVGIGLGVLLAKALAPFGWWFLILGVVLSAICVMQALKAS